MDLTPADARVMRAIAARYHQQALKERREAQAAHQAAKTSPRSRTGWSTRPESQKARKPERQKALQGRAHAKHLEWAKRHPEAAAAERKLRKSRVAMLERWGHKNDGTPQTHEHFAQAQRREGALARLYRTGAINAEQLGAAVEIQATAERIGADVAVRTASLETRVDVTRHGDGSFHESLVWVRREVAYTQWRCAVQQLLRPGAISAVLEMIIGDAPGSDPIPFTTVARRYRIHNSGAKQLLIDALDLWPRILGQVCKEIDREALDAVHARIL